MRLERKYKNDQKCRGKLLTWLSSKLASTCEVFYLAENVGEVSASKSEQEQGKLIWSPTGTAHVSSAYALRDIVIPSIE